MEVLELIITPMKLSIIATKLFPELPGFSGIEYHDQKLYVISDSTSVVYVFDTRDFMQVNAINLTEDGFNIVPKFNKSDLESISFLDDSAEQLLILGSGSKAHKRDIGYLVNIHNESNIALDLYPFYETLAAIPSIGGRAFLNIESLHLQGNNLYLGQRGNTNDSNGFIIVNKNNFLHKIKNKEVPDFKFKAAQLPKLDSKLGGISGATYEDKKLYLVATYEETDNTYDDGLILGSKLLIMNKNLKASVILDFPASMDGNFMKIESICIGPKNELFAVADQDEQGSCLLKLMITD